MGYIRILKFNAEGFPQSHDPTADQIEVHTLKITSGGDGIDANSEPVINVPDGTLSHHAVNKGQLDSAVIVGGSLKELLLHQDQLDNTDGIYAAMACYFSANPSSGDVIILSDGTTTRTYGFGSGGDVTVTIGATPADTMQNFATAVTGDGSGAWDAVFEADDLDEINAGGVVVVHENSTAAGDSTSRMYSATGDWSSGVDCQVVEFAAGGTVDTQYDSNTNANIPLSDPAEGRFGMRRQISAVIDGEMHDNRADNYIYKWDDTTDAWLSMTGPGSIPDATAASGGGTKGKITVDTDDSGLDISAGKIAVDLAASNPGLQITGGDLAALADTTQGIDVGASGIEAKTDGVTTTFDASGNIAAVDGPFELDAGTGGVSKGDPVYVSANDTGLPSDNATLATCRKCVGVAQAAASVGNPFRVQQQGVLTGVTVGGTSPAAGDIVWCDTTSGLTVDIPGTPGSGTARLVAGHLKNSTGPDLAINIQYIGVT